MRGKASRMTEGGEEAEARRGERWGRQRGEEERKAGSSMDTVLRLNPYFWWRDREASFRSSCKKNYITNLMNRNYGTDTFLYLSSSLVDYF